MATESPSPTETASPSPSPSPSPTVTESPTEGSVTEGTPVVLDGFTDDGLTAYQDANAELLDGITTVVGGGLILVLVLLAAAVVALIWGARS